MGFKRNICLVLALLLGLLLAGCNDTAGNGENTVPVETTLPRYTLTFQVEGEVYMQVEATQGSTAEVKDPQIEGARFYGWVDKKGNPVQPDKVPATASQVYKAVLYPDLYTHEPYLFADGNRFLRPDDVLTGDDFVIAINSLAAIGAEKYLPELPEGTETLERGKLQKLLGQMFPESAVEAAFENITGDTVTRAAFAGLMNRLLERNEQKVQAAQDMRLPYDLEPGRADAAALMEAAIRHTHPDTGVSWEQLAQSLKNSQGFFNLDGWLYCVDENGALVRDAQVGVLTFGADGRYSCGDPELDEMVAGILAEIIRNNPDAERIDLLRRAFEYSRDSFQYLRRAAYYFGQTGWEIEDAKKMITTGRGNCYSYAAVFWALGRGLGYETIGISGTMTKTDQPHSWVEIYFDGVPYVFDPEMEMVYRFERDIFDKDMFMVSYEKGTYWNYKRP